MTTEIKVPGLPESVADATVLEWHKQVGEAVSRDDNLVDLETDKVVLEVPAPADGVLKEIKKQPGDVVTAEELLAIFEVGAKGAEPAAEAEKPAEAAPKAEAKPAEPASKPAASVPKAVAPTKDTALSPSQRRVAAEQGLSEEQMASQAQNKSAAMAMSAREEKRVPMSRLRQRIAERLVNVKQTTAMLTTFNEVDMSEVMRLRKAYKDKFEKVHGVRLGFMSFFVKACVEALKRFPEVNASIDGSDIVYHNYFDVGVAVSTDRGLVVPVLKDADHLSMADMEQNIRDFAVRGRAGKLALEEITGGNFTITNGGVFGSMLSTPIINPPQSAILGMHNIVERPVVKNGEIVVAPVMYLALSYDHRIVDGKDSVSFLVAVKELLEDPSKFLLDL